MVSKLIESNIPEGTLWPDLDDSERVRLELLTEAHGVSAMRRTCAALDEVDLSEVAQRRSYNQVRIASRYVLRAVRSDAGAMAEL